MPAVLVALYEQHATAEAARTELVNDGFPTDRVELTSAREPGHAGMIPAEGRAQRFREYFRTLFHGETSERRVDAFTNRVCEGRATVTVHPRGEREIARAKELSSRHHPQELAGGASTTPPWNRRPQKKATTRNRAGGRRKSTSLVSLGSLTAFSATTTSAAAGAAASGVWVVTDVTPLAGAVRAVATVPHGGLDGHGKTFGHDVDPLRSCAW